MFNSINRKSTKKMNTKNIEKRIVEHVKEKHEIILGVVMYNDNYIWTDEGQERSTYIVCIESVEGFQCYMLCNKIYITDNVITKIFTKTEIVEAILHQYHHN